MRLSARIIVPVLVALVSATTILGLLWWQVIRSADLLEKTLHNTKVAAPAFPLSDVFVQPSPVSDTANGDAALVLLREGDLFALQGDWISAEAAYKRSVEKDGGVPALRKLAQAELQLRKFTAAQSTIEDLKDAGARGEDVLLLSGIVELRQGNISALKTLLASGSDSPHAHYLSALLAILEGNHETAKKELAAVMQSWEPVLRTNARTLQSAYDEYALFPESPQSHLITLLSRVLAQVQECELALPLLGQVTSQDGDYRDAWIIQGYCQLSTDRASEALASFSHAYQVDPEKPEIQYFLGRTYRRLNQLPDAQTFFGYAAKNGFVPTAEVQLQIGEVALLQEDWQKALDTFTALVAQPEPTFAQFQGYVASALKLEKYEAAFAQANLAAQRWPKNPLALQLLVQAAEAAGKSDEAEAAKEQLRLLSPAAPPEQVL